jgi:hypothetical protein
VKYLKTYESQFKSFNVHSMLSDISLDLVDNGFLVVVNPILSGHMVSVFIAIDNGLTHDAIVSSIRNKFLSNLEEFDFNDVSSCIKHMISYMESEGFLIFQPHDSSIYVGIDQGFPSSYVRTKVYRDELYNNTFSYGPELNQDSKVKYVDLKFKPTR